MVLLHFQRANKKVLKNYFIKNHMFKLKF